MPEPLRPLTADTLAARVRMMEDAWNTCAPERVALAYSPDSVWHCRTEVLRGRASLLRYLTRKWSRELEYRLVVAPWTFSADRIAVRFAYEWRDDSGNWFRSYGNGHWKLDAAGLVTHRYATVNDQPIPEAGRRLRWEWTCIRPADHAGLEELGL
ncbi:DUF1348 family protein [Dankookia rubra]|uniref:DUF1348 family protein n=1 Tax=Dankookia rubra TaxID=1442381 RepID=A0A4R5QL83_9PROT|nr:DUF1348 family protein [Dankookia rubra]TDH63609.1 DUF1348 family protein [Dankookia rubra]